MTHEEAIKNVTAYVYMECMNMPSQVIKALDIMKDATVKQIPKKPVDIDIKEDGDTYCLAFICPSCRIAVIGQPYKPNHCKHCGQKLDWSDEDDI